MSGNFVPIYIRPLIMNCKMVTQKEVDISYLFTGESSVLRKKYYKLSLRNWYFRFLLERGILVFKKKEGG